MRRRRRLAWYGRYVPRQGEGRRVRESRKPGGRKSGRLGSMEQALSYSQDNKQEEIENQAEGNPIHREEDNVINVWTQALAEERIEQGKGHEARNADHPAPATGFEPGRRTVSKHARQEAGRECGNAQQIGSLHGVTDLIIRRACHLKRSPFVLLRCLLSSNQCPSQGAPEG